MCLHITQIVLSYEELGTDEVLVNLASNEYFKAINLKDLKSPVITCTFKDFKNGEYKSIMTFAKLARGYMTRFIIENECQNRDDLIGFDYPAPGSVAVIGTPKLIP